MSNEKLIEIKNLKKYFNIGGGQTLKAVDDVTFDIYKGETIGIVGESGCGKTTLGRTLTVLYKRSGGEVKYNGKDISSYAKKDLARCFQMIFQDPDASLDPRMTCGDIIAEGLDIFKMCKSKQERTDIVAELLEKVGLNREHVNRFPHEFSGGQKQRIGIARAIALKPDFIVCDEPISALDVSIQAQVVNLLKNLQIETGLTFLFIAHDLSMVKYISDRVGVMYLGEMVELTDSNTLYDNPLHPYTISLLSAIPKIENLYKDNPERVELTGEIPSPIDPPPGCKFNTRCKYAIDRCKTERPIIREVEPGHFVSCHIVEQKD